MISYIKELEKRSNKQRGEFIKMCLSKLDIVYQTQKVGSFIFTGENIIVNYPFNKPASRNNKYIVLSAHFNKFLNSPGANDNASGVAVLLEIVKKLKTANLIAKNIRFIFFDLEDGCIPSRIGSKEYIRQFGYKDIDWLINLDGTGMGDCISIESLDRSLENQFIPRTLIQTAKSFRLPIFFIRKTMISLKPFGIPRFAWDHTSFIQAGFTHVFGIGAVHKKDLWFYKLFREEDGIKILIALFKHIFNRKAPWPKIVKHYHNNEDLSKFIEEKTLENVFKIIWHSIFEIQF